MPLASPPLRAFAVLLRLMPFALDHFVALSINLFQINSFSGRLIAIVMGVTINPSQHPSGLIALKDDY